MDDDDKVLLEIWREVGRHIVLTESLANIVNRLAPALPLATLEILHFDRGRADLETAAICRRDRERPAHGRRIGLHQEDFHRLLEWSRVNRVALREAGSAWPAVFRPLQGYYGEAAVLIGALRDPQEQAIGLAVFELAAGREPPTSARIIEGLLEPLAVATLNDLRLHELDVLRAAAEADRQSLLHRLGRESVGDVIVGSHGGLRAVLQRVDQVARSDASVLLLGETGSGKEVVARAIHERSPRQGGPFMRVNCGAIPADLIDSELFGHERGSFTGAIGQRKGWFERADGGTLFLDEIGELPLPAQVRLLRVLQEGSLYRVGGEQPVQVDVRIIAATHRDLAVMAARGAFREDLWYRIAVFPILIPPLRERSEDIPDLARHFASRAAVKLGQAVQLPAAEDIALLRAYAWPGNVREMAAVIERAAILGEGRRLAIATALGLATPILADSKAGAAVMSTLDEAMTQHIRRAIEHTQGRIEGPHGAARLLGINPNTLRSRMRKLGVARRMEAQDASRS